MRMAGRALFTALMALLAAEGLQADVPTEDRAANLLGYVRDIATGQPVTGASVELVSMSTVRITNELGFFAFTDVPLGDQILVIESLGYEERRLLVTLDDDKSFGTEILLGTVPLELEGLSVNVIPRRTFNELRDLDIRLGRGFGRFVLRKEMEQRGGNLITLIQSMPGVRIQGSGSMMSNRTVILRRAAHIVSTAPGVMAIANCYPAVFVDGRRFSRRASLGDQPTDLTEFIASDMDVVEVYSGTSVPAAFGGGDAACGAILIWTRRGPAWAGTRRN
jgi:hypothetical protein